MLPHTLPLPSAGINRIRFWGRHTSPLSLIVSRLPQRYQRDFITNFLMIVKSMLNL